MDGVSRLHGQKENSAGLHVKKMFLLSTQNICYYKVIKIDHELVLCESIVSQISFELASISKKIRGFTLFWS